MGEITEREYFESKLAAIEQARSVAYDAMDKRLDGMNEFRETLKDQASRFVTRDEMCAEIKALDSDIRILREYRATLEGKASQTSVNIAYAFSAIAVLIGIIGIILQLVERGVRP